MTALARLYAVAADACRPLDFTSSETTDPAEELIRGYETDQRRRLTELFKKLRALSAAQPTTEAVVDRLVRPAKKAKQYYVVAADAFRERGYPFDDQKVRRICQRHAGDFAIKLSVWHVREPQFSEFADRVDRGEVTF